MRGLRTLAVRMERASANALVLALWLAERPEVERVHYPGLPDHPAADLVERQMRGSGRDAQHRAAWRRGARTALRGRDAALHAGRVAGRGRVADRAAGADDPRLGRRVAPGRAAGLVRLSVGIESVDDLRADLEAAFAASVS